MRTHEEFTAKEAREKAFVNKKQSVAKKVLTTLDGLTIEEARQVLEATADLIDQQLITSGKNLP